MQDLCFAQPSQDFRGGGEKDRVNPPVTCMQCGLSFVDKHVLKRHMSTYLFYNLWVEFFRFENQHKCLPTTYTVKKDFVVFASRRKIE